ncbi:DUF6707 family protein [Phocaeicola dorei]|jgi:hypothetical protein|uniref:DUF6707 family protein n=1 Tax=Phocaeicola dorei TaxID=357276 RepID=UPI0032C19EA1
METGKELFESIMNSCPKKKVMSLCKKLIKKCSFNSGADAENLCHLAYRLFVYGYIEEALAVCRYTHDVPFPGKGIFNVWDFILFIWRLEVFLLQKEEKYEEANTRVKEIDYIHIQPVNAIFNTPEKCRKFANERYQRVSYPDVLEREKIEESEQYANNYRFIALFYMIGYGATGLYPNLSAHWKELQQDINNYVSILSKEK